jgi:hypothetical protein
VTVPSSSEWRWHPWGALLSHFEARPSTWVPGVFSWWAEALYGGEEGHPGEAPLPMRVTSVVSEDSLAHLEEWHLPIFFTVNLLLSPFVITRYFGGDTLKHPASG